MQCLAEACAATMCQVLLPPVAGPAVASYKWLRSFQGADLTESSRQGQNMNARLCSGTPAYPLQLVGPAVPTASPSGISN
jgi:hypothetical protein